MLSPDKVKDLYNNDIDLNYYKKAYDNLNLQLTDSEKRITNLSDQNDKLAKRVEASDSSFLEKLGFFILGAGITGLLGYGIYRSK